MKKRIERNGEDVLDGIARLSAEADWTEEEIDEALREDGINPEQLVNQVISEVRAVFPNFPEQLAGAAREASQSARADAGQTRMEARAGGGPRPSTTTAISSLFEAGEKLGMDKFGLAARLRLSIGIITKLNQRLIECSTVPMALVRELASTIGHSVDEVLEYLRCKPRLAPGLSFKADEAPELPQPQDFVEAVEKDRSLDPERKKELLELARGR
jgi:hypothetical protein